MSVQLHTPLHRPLDIHRNVLETMWSFAQWLPDATEAGGILIGHEKQSGEMHLDRLTTPQEGDRRTRTRFYRSVAGHQDLLNFHWHLSGHTRTYFGEWHTHPEPCPTPSGIDLRSWRKHLKQPETQGAGGHFIIVGTQLTRVWYAQHGELQLTLIGEIETEVFP